MRRVLIVVDMQNDFIAEEGVLSSPAGRKIVPFVCQKVQMALQMGDEGSPVQLSRCFFTGYSKCTLSLLMVAAQSSGQEIRSIKDMEYWHVNTITILLSFSLEPGEECSIALEYQGPGVPGSGGRC